MKNYEKDYHVKQIMNPYRSTEVFVDWIADEILCEGGGENIRYGMWSRCKYNVYGQ